MDESRSAKDEETKAHTLENQNREYLAGDNLVLKAEHCKHDRQFDSLIFQRQTQNCVSWRRREAKWSKGKKPAVGAIYREVIKHQIPKRITMQIIRSEKPVMFSITGCGFVVQ